MPQRHRAIFRSFAVTNTRRMTLAISVGFRPRAELRIEEKRGASWRPVGQWISLDLNALTSLARELPDVLNVLALTAEQEQDRQASFGRTRRRSGA